PARPASTAIFYVLSWGWRWKLSKSAVQLSVLHPGPMDTSEENAGRIDKHGFLGKLVHLRVDEVAEIGVNQLLSGKTVIIPGIYNKICIRLLKTIPRRIAMPILSKVLRKEAKKVPKPAKRVETTSLN